MSKRWLNEEQLSQLPPRMTARALGGGALKKQSAPARKSVAVAPSAVSAPSAGASPAQSSTQRMQALGRLPAGTMNKTEAAYDRHLEQRKFAGEVAWYKFEGIKLRLACSTFYTVDFFVMLTSGELEAHEVKGFWTDDARVKIKVAAEQYPLFKFIAIKKGKASGGETWSYEEF